MTSLIYQGAFMSRTLAENAREDFLKDYEMEIVSGSKVIIEDDIKYINSHYVTRVMIQDPQGEFDFD